MTPIKLSELNKFQTRYTAGNSTQRLIVVGETVNTMGADLPALLADNQRQGFPCELLRAVSRCLAHA